MKPIVWLFAISLSVGLCVAGCSSESAERDSIDSVLPANVQPNTETPSNPALPTTIDVSVEPESAPFVPPAPLAENPSEETEPETILPEPAEEDLVNVLDYIPSLYVNLRYATEDNFTGVVLYDFTDARLRYGTVKKLAEVQEELLEQGYSLQIWDAYRPVSAQFRLWEVCPDATYVANPNTGYSSHSRGSTLDVTMVTADGTSIAMPSGFDDFSALADRDYSDVSQEAADHARLLENTMTAHGFTGYNAEWWHYSDSVAYPVVEEE